MRVLVNDFHVSECVDFMENHMKPESVDLTVTSPPYDNLREYNGYKFDFESITKQLYRVLKIGGVVVWVVNDKTINGDKTGTSFAQALYFKEIGFMLYDVMIFSKPARPFGSGQTRYYDSFEYMFILSKGKPKTINLLKDRKNKDTRNKNKGTQRLPDGTMRTCGDKQGHNEYGRRTNIWEYSVGYNSQTKDKIAHRHPAIFPEKLAQDHILSWSNEGDLIFDPMCGSGTVGKMAFINNRKFICVDISEDYINIAKQRIQEIQMRLL